MNTRINFELAKLLKEKGFTYGFGGGQKFYFPETKELTENHRGNNYPAPTIAEVVMWLYEKHGIWIQVELYVVGSDEWDYGFIITHIPKEFQDAKRRSIHLITINSFSMGFGSYSGAWHSPTEAYQEAIKYTLTNLL